MKKYLLPGIISVVLAIALPSCKDNTVLPAESYTKVELFMGTGNPALGELNLSPLQTDLYLPLDMTPRPDGIYVVDWNNHRILKVANNLVTLVIGTGELGDATDGPATGISLNHPTHISFDPQGYLIMSAWHNSKVMRMVSDNMVTIVGDGSRDYRGDGGLATDAWVNLPSSTVFDDQGNMYVSDEANQRIRMIDNNKMIKTIVGTGVAGFSGDEGPADQAQINGPVGQAAFPASKLAFDHLGNLYLADTWNNRIRMIDKNGIIHTVAGNGDQGYSGDGLATEESLYWPCDIAFDSENNLFIADTFNHCIRKVDKDGQMTTFAGVGGVNGSDGLGGPPAQAQLFKPWGIAFDENDNLYIADTNNHRILLVKKYL